MKQIIKTIFFLLIIITFISCEDVVQVKLDEGSKLYVIDAFINSLRSQQIVKITNNSSYFSKTTPVGIAGAYVVLKDLTDNKQYVFTYSNNGNYIFTLSANDTLAKPNHNYELNVVIDGVAYLANTTQKRYASIDSIGVELNDQNFNFGPGAPSILDTTYFCVLYAKDKADKEADFYWLKTFRNDSLLSDGDEINLNIDGTGGEITDPPSDSLYFTPPSTLLGFKTFHRNDRCRVEVHSIMRNTYNFFIQAQSQISNGGLFATTPENVKTNFGSPDGKIKAVGWFSVASVATKSIIID